MFSSAFLRSSRLTPPRPKSTATRFHRPKSSLTWQNSAFQETGIIGRGKRPAVSENAYVTDPRCRKQGLRAPARPWPDRPPGTTEVAPGAGVNAPTLSRIRAAFWSAAKWTDTNCDDSGKAARAQCLVGEDLFAPTAPRCWEPTIRRALPRLWPLSPELPKTRAPPSRTGHLFLSGRGDWPRRRTAGYRGLWLPIRLYRRTAALSASWNGSCFNPAKPQFDLTAIPFTPATPRTVW